MATAEDTVFLTGATGFVGGHVLRSLLDGGYSVKALVRRNTDELPLLQHAGVDDVGGISRLSCVVGDVLRAGALTRELKDCRYVMHVAGQYSFAQSQRQSVWQTNVRGTASLLEAARLAGIEKAVVTSSSATIGPARNRKLPSEADWAVMTRGGPTYHKSKIIQERATLGAQIPTVLLLPTTPIGPGDAKPTPTGKLVVDFMKGRIFARMSGGLNVVPVEDVARAHILALERGTPGDRYLAGGTNLALTELFALMARVCKRPAPKFELPYPLAMAASLIDELRCRITPSAEPMVPLEGVRMGRELMFVSSRKAESELGYHAGSVISALERAVEWFREHGYAR